MKMREIQMIIEGVIYPEKKEQLKYFVSEFLDGEVVFGELINTIRFFDPDDEHGEIGLKFKIVKHYNELDENEQDKIRTFQIAISPYSEEIFIEYNAPDFFV